MRKKIFMIALLLLVAFIAGYYQWNLFLTSIPVPVEYFLVLILIDAMIAASAIIIFKFTFQKNIQD